MKNILKKELIEKIEKSKYLNLVFGGTNKYNILEDEQKFKDCLDTIEIDNDNNRHFSRKSSNIIYFDNGSRLDFSQHADKRLYLNYNNFYIYQYINYYSDEVLYTTIIYKIY